MQTWVPRTVWEAVSASAAARPDARAVVCESQTVSYAMLVDLASRASLGLYRLGVRQGDKVGLWLPNGIPFLAAALGVSRLGAVVVAINPRFRPEEVGYVLRQSDSVAVLLGDDQTGAVDQAEILAGLCPEIRRASSGHFASEALPHLRTAIWVGPNKPSGLASWNDVLALGADDAEEVEGPLRQIEASVKPDDVTLFQYTSGSTAFPKAVMLSHENIVRNAWYFGEALAMAPTDVYLVPLPFFHVGGLVTGALCALVHGACLVTMGRYDPAAFLRLAETERCTALAGVETTYLMALDQPDFQGYDLSGVQKCIALGTGELIRRIHDQMGVRHVSTLYGISEAGPNVSMVRVGEPLEVSLRTMGRPQRGVEVLIVDPEQGEALAHGQVGEIRVRGWNVMKGYYKEPEETAKTIDAEGWLRTGDLGFLDEQGYLVFSGRLKNVIRVGGENVSAEEVENCLLSHPAVKIAQVVAGPDPRLGEVCVAYIELKEGSRANEEEIVAHCRPRLAGFKMPRQVRFVSASDWPMTGSGKIQRFKLREREYNAELAPSR